MKRQYTVKIEGQEHATEGGFSYGAFNAMQDVLNKHFTNLSPIPGGRIVSYSGGVPMWRFEAIDHAQQLGFTVWVTETSY